MTDTAVYTLSHAHSVGRIDPTTNTFTSVPAPPGAGELADREWLGRLIMQRVSLDGWETALDDDPSAT